MLRAFLLTIAAKIFLRVVLYTEFDKLCYVAPCLYRIVWTLPSRFAEQRPAQILELI